MRTIKHTLIAAVFAALFLAPAATALAAYLGPNRTVTETTTVKRVYLYECMYIEATGRWRYHRIEDWPASLESKPWLAYSSSPSWLGCVPATNGHKYWERVDVEQTTTTTYPPATVSGALQNCTLNNGWCGVTAPVLALSGIEPVSGYAITAIEGTLNGQPFSCAGAACNRALTEGNNAFTFWALSSFGDSSLMGTLTAKVDLTPPQITPSISGTAGANGWYVSMAGVNATASDALSGVQGTVDVSQDGGATWRSLPLTLADGRHSLNLRAYDKAGNVRKDTVEIKIDTIAPNLAATTDGVLGLDGWYVSGAITTVSAGDALSGVERVEYDLNGSGWQSGSSIPLSDGINSISIRAFDKAGNAKSDSLTIKVDTAPPIIEPSVSGTTGASGWLISPGVISAAVNDGTSGVSGGVEVSFDGGSSWEAAPVTLTDGVYAMTFRAYDKAGNEGRAPLSVSIDTIPPAVALTVSGTPGKNGWYVSDVQVTAPASDAVSGVDSTSVRANEGAWVSSLTLSDGAYRLEARAVDRAGNENTDTAELRIDTKAPSSAFSGFSDNEVVKGDITLTGQAFDTGSGVDRVEVSLDGGTTWLPADLAGDSWTLHWDTASIPNGVYSILVRAADAAGNVERPLSVLTLTIDNLPPKVKITDWWWIWDSGEYKISSNTFPVKNVTVVISDPAGRWAPVKLEYNPGLSSASVVWDRRFGDVLAPSGNYRVLVTACDIHDNCAADQGVIKIPFFAPVPSATSSPLPSPVVSEPVSTPVPSPAPRVEPQHGEAVPSTVSFDSPTGTGLIRDLSWIAVALSIMVLYFGAVALSDPRPAAIHALARAINQFNNKR
jgi:hypothetical protein